jgi:hypothetical protein
VIFSILLNKAQVQIPRESWRENRDDEASSIPSGFLPSKALGLYRLKIHKP